LKPFDIIIVWIGFNCCYFFVDFLNKHEAEAQAYFDNFGSKSRSSQK